MLGRMKNPGSRAAFHFTLTALYSAIAFMAIPGYRIWVVVSIVNLGIAYWAVCTTRLRKLICVSFIAAVAVSGAAGALRRPSGQMYDLAVLILVVSLVAATFVAYTVYVERSQAA